MPVNMDPSKKRRRNRSASTADPDQGQTTDAAAPSQHAFGEETAEDREKDLADAELKNLWDATEVIDMDKV